MHEGYKGPVLDAANEYDAVELAAEYGRISFYFTEDEEHTKENLYNRLVQSRELLKNSDVKFSLFSASYRLGGGVYRLMPEDLFEGDLKQIVEERYFNYYSDEST